LVAATGRAALIRVHPVHLRSLKEPASGNPPRSEPTVRRADHAEVA
jgi:hypothetical protein